MKIPVDELIELAVKRENSDKVLAVICRCEFCGYTIKTAYDISAADFIYKEDFDQFFAKRLNSPRRPYFPSKAAGVFAAMALFRDSFGPLLELRCQRCNKNSSEGDLTK